jgi:hypothetical protein
VARKTAVTTTSSRSRPGEATENGSMALVGWIALAMRPGADGLVERNPATENRILNSRRG